jgi:hypothetical protein
VKISFIVSSLLLGTWVLASESIYDGTGSLINANQECWGCNKDEADMQVHENKNSTVTFQILKDDLKCNHIDIHAGINMGQEVIISAKEWKSKKIERSYRVKLPVGKYSSKDGISLRLEHGWTTISITSTKPIDKVTPIYAYCRSSIDELNEIGLEEISPIMTKLENNHYYLGNGSLITASKDNGQDGFGITRDLAVTSERYNAETSFQVLSNKDSCQEVTIYNYNNNIRKITKATVEDIFIKGWAESKWKPTSCEKLPCTINTFFSKDNSPAYMLINIKTRANNNQQLYAKCGKKDSIKFIDEKFIRPRNLHSCKFEDLNGDWSDKYIEALCSAGIVEGYGETNYTKFGPNNPTLWQELVKVVTLADNYYKTKKYVDEYKANNPYDDWSVPYLHLASKRDYNYNGSMKVTRGLAFQYVVDVFWDKRLSENESAIFLKDKKVITDLNTDRYLTRAEMAKVVLNSARFSGDENSIERKLPYTNHEDSKLNEEIEKEQSMPSPQTDKPKITDSEEKKKETRLSNADKIYKGQFVSNSEKGKTDNKSIVDKTIGDVDDKFKNKDTKEVKNMLEEEGKLKDIYDNTNLPSDTVIFGKDKSGQDTIGYVGGDKKINLEVNSKNKNTGETKKEIVKMTLQEAKNKLGVTFSKGTEAKNLERKPR